MNFEKIFQIKHAVFWIKNNQLFINKKIYETSQKTIDALQMFLSSSNQMISKDEIMLKIWGKSIVTESSIFKQIKAVRHILKYAGLEDDTIVNVYGSGYKVKYPITIFSADEIQLYQKNPSSFFSFWVIAIVILIISFFVIINYPKNQISLISADRKESLTAILKQDWLKGLSMIDELIENRSDEYSKSDFAFLYLKKGNAELQLQKPLHSIDSLNKAIDLEDDLVNQSKILVLLARAYSSANNMEMAIDTINSSIKLQKENENEQLVVAYMTKSLLLRKLGSIDESIKYNVDSMNMSKRIKDTRGEMIAVNNLSTTYHQIGNIEKAIQMNKLGIDLCLKHGTSQHIANAYNANSILQMQNNNIEESFRMIELSLKYQVTNNNLRYLAPKLLNYIRMLIQVEKYEYASQLLELTKQFIEKANASAKTRGAYYMLKGLNLLNQNKISSSMQSLDQSLVFLQQTTDKVNTIQLYGYFSMAYLYDENYLKSIEFAKLALSHESASDKVKFLSYTVLAMNYYYLNQLDLYDQSLLFAKKFQGEPLSFELNLYYQMLLLNLKEQLNKDSINLKLNELKIKQSAIINSITPNKEIYNSLKNVIEN